MPLRKIEGKVRSVAGERAEDANSETNSVPVSSQSTSDEGMVSKRSNTGQARSESVASRGEARRDAPSGGKKRRNESPHNQERGSKAMKLFSPSSQDLFDSMWVPGGLQLQKGRLGTITGVNRLDGGPEMPNMVGQFVGSISDFVTANTTGQGPDQDAFVLDDPRLAASRSATGEVVSIHIPIHRDDNPFSATSGGRAARTPQDGPRKLLLTHLMQRNKAMKPWMSSRNSSPAPSTRSNVRGDKVDRAAAKGKDKVAGAIDLTKEKEAKATEAQTVDLTVLDDATLCEICPNMGSHTTGRCGRVTSMAHGDTTTDPFCNISASRSRNGPDQSLHALQGPQKGKLNIACPNLRSCWESYNLKHAWRKLVVERRRMPPLAVYTEHFCFVAMTLEVSRVYFNGEMPPEMEGIWPYTKADAVKFEKECDKFWETGMENMPRGELEGLTMAEVRQAYENGRIMPQVRHEESAQMRKRALVPSGLTRSIDHDGDLQMDDTTSSSLSKRVGPRHRMRREDVLEDSEIAAEAQDEKQSVLRIGRSLEKVRRRR
ncbi:hypothetical protein KVR01_004649 [Diaporthe batatas]|uniref:uncharacterized protein n=1 Tax=Diaporthe batatas TaxID=748121 RepID=UPI001D05586D|nr:uncharacterized protein KVR01_004649 [Diaporthe batatas]KAG8166097.1 hypothetical protein KVR01_004649 [Diaporthe batatas]